MRKQEVANMEMQTRNRFISHWSGKEEVGHTVLVLTVYEPSLKKKKLLD